MKFVSKAPDGYVCGGGILCFLCGLEAVKTIRSPFGLLIAICYSLISMLSLRYLLIFILRSGIINTTKLNNGLEF